MGIKDGETEFAERVRATRNRYVHHNEYQYVLMSYANAGPKPPAEPPMPELTDSTECHCCREAIQYADEPDAWQLAGGPAHRTIAARGVKRRVIDNNVTFETRVLA